MKKYLYLIAIIILCSTITTYFYMEENIAYSSKAVSIMKKYNVYNQIDKQNYSKTLDFALNSNNFNEKYVNNYQNIDYVEVDNFITKVNTLLNNSYSNEEINDIFKYISKKNIEKLLEEDKLDLKPYYYIKNFEVDKLDKYEEYKDLHNCSLEEAVLKVNIGLDHDFYTQIEEIENSNEYTVLVNKYHSLGTYAPNDLKSLSYDSRYKLRAKAADAFEQLVAAGKLDNVYIRPYSAYRSYQTQKTLYNNYVARDGVKEADTYSARPGHSEHQTGLAVDVWSEGYNEIRESDAKWLQDNSYKYGFIIRYTKENMPITGYIEEPWHLRYLGVDIATDVVDKDITYDEYYDLYLK